MFSSPDMRDFSEFAHASAFRTYDLSDGLSGEFYHVKKAVICIRDQVI